MKVGSKHTSNPRRFSIRMDSGLQIIIVMIVIRVIIVIIVVKRFDNQSESLETAFFDKSFVSVAFFDYKLSVPTASKILDAIACVNSDFSQCRYIFSLEIGECQNQFCYCKLINPIQSIPALVSRGWVVTLWLWLAMPSHDENGTRVARAGSRCEGRGGFPKLRMFPMKFSFLLCGRIVNDSNVGLAKAYSPLRSQNGSSSSLVS